MASGRRIPEARRGMLAAVNARRFAAVAVVVLGVAAMLGSCSGPDLPACGFPTLGETAEDGGPDPCHCAPPPSLNLQACPCLNGTPGDADVYRGCMALYRDEMDAGVD
jgi:hypothetical protein